MKLALIIPFMNPEGDLSLSGYLCSYIPKMREFLDNIETIDYYKIYIVEQNNQTHQEYNKGKLINSFLSYFRQNISEMEEDFDSFVIQDLHMEPTPILGAYYGQIPKVNPIHIASGAFAHLQNAKSVGGVIAFSKQQLIDIDGFPNIYWGGGDYNELYERLNSKGYKAEKLPLIEGGMIDRFDELVKTVKKPNYNARRGADKLHKKFRNNHKKEEWWGLKNVIYKLDEDMLRPHGMMGYHIRHITIDIGSPINDPKLPKNTQTKRKQYKKAIKSC